MPFIREKAPVVIDVRGVFGPCVGSASDFVALAYCPDLDEAELKVNPDHKAFTHILRFQGGRRQIVGKYPARLEGLTQVGEGRWIAVGDAAGYVQISANGLTEVAIPGMRGVQTAVWAASEAELVSVGSFPAFAYHCRDGEQVKLSLPSGTLNLLDVCGLSKDDVYLVGGKGQVHHFDGQHVTRLRAPAQADLSCIVKLDDQRMAIGGYQGTLLVGASTRWRRIITDTHSRILALAALNGRVYFGADGCLWSTDGESPVTSARSFEGDWVCGLTDALVLVDVGQAWLYSPAGLIELDTTLK